MDHTPPNSLDSMKMRRLSLLLLLPLALACGTGEDGDDDNTITPRDGGVSTERDGGEVVVRDGGTRDGGAAERDGGLASIPFADTQALFDLRCSPCHDQGNQRRRIVVREYDNIVNQPSPATGMPYITPGDPDNSWIYRKITNTQAAVCQAASVPTRNCGGIMPTNQGTALTQQQIDDVRDWITAGAAR